MNEPIPWSMMEVCCDEPELPVKLTLKEWFDKVVPALRDYLYLTSWQITVLFQKEDDADNSLMSIKTDAIYMAATIFVYPKMKEKYDHVDGATVGLDVVHELCHILTDPLYKIATDAVTNCEVDWLGGLRENTTQRVALAVWRGVPTELFSTEQ